MIKVDPRQIMSMAKFYESYSRYNEELKRYETWEEAVTRVMNMHRDFYKDKMTKELSNLIDEVEQGYKDKLFVGSQRALQFGGEQLLKNHARLYNCSSVYMDRVEVFAEAFHLMLSGCGVGFSVQKQHIKNIPSIKGRDGEVIEYIIPDIVVFIFYFRW
jgi:ribonucleoside-triphosphate reductase (thioredoxin)